MKTKLPYSLICLFVTAAVSVTIAAEPGKADKLVVHEWGTFTSVQGADGKPIMWQPFETSDLPSFVYDWKNPGLGRKPISAFNKGFTFTLQRMETPVIYFYSDIERAVNVSVKFPSGTITEWYPQATRIGPIAAEFGALFADPSANTARDSRIEWTNLKVLPSKANPALAKKMPFEKTGNHYFAARETDSDFVSFIPGNKSETEKFLFYRGVGMFSTPLNVTMRSDDELVVKNTGNVPLTHLFVYRSRGKSCRIEPLNALNVGEERVVDLRGSDLPRQRMASDLKRLLQDALVKEGLYKREAEAMVATWKSSWFQEEGLRVLYLLPQSWTDGVLPLKLNPKPDELVRVMVGRVEMISPGLGNRIREQLVKTIEGDAQARVQLQAELRTLGRFARPAIDHAVINGRMREVAYKLIDALPKQSFARVVRQK